MESYQSEKKEETLRNNRTHSGQPPGVTDKIEETPSPGRPGMCILTRYPITVNTLMKAVGV